MTNILKVLLAQETKSKDFRASGLDQPEKLESLYPKVQGLT